jgi:cobalamin biosynthesis protein CobT
MKVKPANQPNAKLARKEKQSTQKGKTEQLSASDESEADEEEEDDEDEEEEDEAEEDHEGRKGKNKRPPNVQRGSVSSAPATPAAKPPFPPQSPIDTLDDHSDVDKQLVTLRMQLKTKKLAEVAPLGARTERTAARQHVVRHLRGRARNIAQCASWRLIRRSESVANAA